jgi:hypothetical protein
VKEVAADPLILTLTGLGITYAPHQFAGGMFLALAAAALAARISPGRDAREWWVTMLTGALCAIVVAELGSQYRLDIAPQLPMVLAGFLSRFIASGLLGIAQRLERRSSDIADRLLSRVLPGEDEKDETPKGKDP